MKKLNRKGFTLIELLAVIVILAIVLVVTIPAVISSLNNARQKSLQNAADTVQDWFQKNYDIKEYAADLGSESVDSTFNTFYSDLAKPTTEEAGTTYHPVALTPTIAEAAGISNADDNLVFCDESSNGCSTVTVVDNNKICVTLVAKSDGSFYSTTASTHALASAGCTVTTSVPAN